MGAVVVTPVTDLLDDLRVMGEPAGLDRELTAVAQGYAEPMRVGLVGRVSSGKSTLVNAIVGRRVAATAAEDCTRLTTIYRYGTPEAVDCVLVDGSRHPLPLAVGERDPVIAALPDPEHLEVTLSTARLKGTTLIDTPGLQGTLGEATASMSEALTGFDVLLYLFRGSLRADDDQVAAEFSAATGGRPARHVVGLLSHADNFGAGAWDETDPIDAARISAADLHQRHPGRFAAMLAISTLLGESARTGRFTEDRTLQLRRLADVSPDLLRFAGLVPPPGVPTEVMTDLLAVAAPYGVAHGRRHAETPARLSAWAESRSGFNDLEIHLEQVARPLVLASRLERVAETVSALVPRFPPAERRHAATVIERHVSGPRFHLIRELQAHRDLVRDAPGHPLRRDLEQLLGAPRLPERREWLGKISGGRPDRAAALAQAGRYAAMGPLARLGAEAQAIRTLSASMVNLAGDLG